MREWKTTGLLPPRIAVAVTLEIAYVLLTRLWLREQLAGLPLELAITAVRIVVATIDYLLFRRLFARGRPSKSAFADPLFVIVVLTFLATPVLVAGGVASGTLRTVFAFTSVAVAAHEEVFYRGIVQRLLEQRFGLVATLGISNGLFVLCHIGAQPMNVFVTAEIFAAGCILGMVYFISDSILSAVVLHSAYDSVYAFSPLLGPGIARPWFASLQLLALLLCVLWVCRSRPTATPLQTPSQQSS